MPMFEVGSGRCGLLLLSIAVFNSMADILQFAVVLSSLISLLQGSLSPDREQIHDSNKHKELQTETVCVAEN